MKKLLLFIIIVLVCFPCFAADEDRAKTYVINSFDKGLVSHVGTYLTPKEGAEEAQNVRFNKRYGSVSKRDSLLSYGTIGSSKVTSLHRYYKSDETSKLIATGGTNIYVGDDDTGTFSVALDSMVISNGSNLILDNVYTDNTTVVCPSTFINYYVSNDGTNFQGTKARGNNFSQVMRNNTDGQYVRNSKFIWTVCMKDAGNITPKTFEMTNVEFKSPQSDAANPASSSFFNYDFYCVFNGLTTASVVVDVYNWTNCTSPDRADKIIRCKFGNQDINSFPVSTDSTMNHNFFYDIELTVTDEAGNKIENATVSVANSKATPDVYSGTTDANGYKKLTPKCYDIVIDPDNADGYTIGGSTRKFYSKTTLFNDITLTISKSGYETYTGIISGVLTAQDMTIALKTAKTTRMDLDGNLYSNLDKTNTGKMVCLLKV